MVALANEGPGVKMGRENYVMKVGDSVVWTEKTQNFRGTIFAMPAGIRPSYT